MVLQDELNKYLNITDGVYVECGSNDGVFQTNTIDLEKNKNWSGFLIEASPKSFNDCLINRDNDKNIILNCALVSFDYELDFVEGDFDGHPMSSVDGNRLNRNDKIKVKARTFDSILKEYDISKIDLFVIDVEGFELNVLKGIDFNWCAPSYLCIEVYTDDKENIDDFLIEKGYELVSNLTNFNIKDDPYWDGTHNDYLYKKIK